MCWTSRDGPAIEITHLHALLGDDREIAIVQEEHVARVIKDGGAHRRRRNILSLPRPMTDGGPKRAATILLGRRRKMTLSAKDAGAGRAGLADGFFEGDFGPVTAFGMEYSLPK